MKKGRFLWSAHRITERQKAGKARNIKGKQLKNSRNTVWRPPVVLPSSPSAKKVILFPGKLRFSGVFLCLLLQNIDIPKSEGTEFWNYRPQYLVVCRKMQHNFSGYHLRLLAHFALFFGLSGYHLRLFFGPEFCSKIIVIMICSFLLKLWLWCAILKLPYHHGNFVGRIMMFTKDQLSALLHANGKEGIIHCRRILVAECISAGPCKGRPVMLK